MYDYTLNFWVIICKLHELIQLYHSFMEESVFFLLVMQLDFKYAFRVQPIYQFRSILKLSAVSTHF